MKAYWSQEQWDIFGRVLAENNTNKFIFKIYHRGFHVRTDSRWSRRGGERQDRIYFSSPGEIGAFNQSGDVRMKHIFRKYKYRTGKWLW